MMKKSRKGSQRGVALLMVLIALTILGAMTADFMEVSEVYMANSVNHRDAVKAEYLARSGVNLSRLMMSVQPLLGGALNFPFWQYADLIMEPFNGGKGEDSGGMMTDMLGIDLSGVQGLGMPEGEEFTVIIIDEESKVNVNVGAAQQRGRKINTVNALTQLMAPKEYDDIFDKSNEGTFLEREDVICEILDWADPDEDLCDGSGGESASFYGMLDPPYERKNAPYDSLEELHYVKGIGDDFWSAFVDPDIEDPERRVMTVWGNGMINVNTTPAQNLVSFMCVLTTDESGIGPCMTGDLFNIYAIAQAMTTMRGIMPYGSIPDFIKSIEVPEEYFFLMPGLVGVPVSNPGFATQFLTTKSSVFSIYATGTVGRSTKRIHVVVDTEGRDELNPQAQVSASGGKILYWRME